MSKKFLPLAGLAIALAIVSYLILSFVFPHKKAVVVDTAVKAETVFGAALNEAEAQPTATATEQIDLAAVSSDPASVDPASVDPASVDPANGDVAAAEEAAPPAEALVEPASEPAAEPLAASPEPAAAEPAPEVAAAPAPVAEVQSEPAPATVAATPSPRKSKPRAAQRPKPAADALAAWWATPATGEFGLVYAGQSRGELAIALLFSEQPADSGLTQSVKVYDPKGELVSSAWEAGTNPRLAVLRGLKRGRYTVVVESSLASASGKTINKAQHGAVYIS